MEAFEIRDLSFAYPEQRQDTLSHISFSIPPGAVRHPLRSFRLREKHPPAAPAGYRRGEILFEGVPLNEVD